MTIQLTLTALPRMSRAVPLSPPKIVAVRPTHTPLARPVDWMNNLTLSLRTRKLPVHVPLTTMVSPGFALSIADCSESAGQFTLTAQAGEETVKKVDSKAKINVTTMFVLLL